VITQLTYIKKRDSLHQQWALNYWTEIFSTAPNTHKQHTHLFVPSTQLTWNHLKKQGLFTQGTRISVQARGALHALWSSTNLIQLEGAFRGSHCISDHARILARFQGGTTWVDHSNKIPLSMRFFAGGDQSVRGYAYKSLGPTVGGKHFIFSSLEAERRVYQSLTAALFTDAGNAMNHWSLRKTYHSVGLGLRWLTPLGSLKLDLAKPLTRPYHKIRLHIIFGID
jgi:translocation and assembly module TamA